MDFSFDLATPHSHCVFEGPSGSAKGQRGGPGEPESEQVLAPIPDRSWVPPRKQQTTDRESLRHTSGARASGRCCPQMPRLKTSGGRTGTRSHTCRKQGDNPQGQQQDTEWQSSQEGHSCAGETQDLEPALHAVATRDLEPALRAVATRDLEPALHARSEGVGRGSPPGGRCAACLQVPSWFPDHQLCDHVASPPPLQLGNKTTLTGSMGLFLGLKQIAQNVTTCSPRDCRTHTCMPPLRGAQAGQFCRE